MRNVSGDKRNQDTGKESFIFDLSKVDISVLSGGFERHLAEDGVTVPHNFSIRVRDRNVRRGHSTHIKWISVDVVPLFYDVESEWASHRFIRNGSTELRSGTAHTMHVSGAKLTYRLENSKHLDENNKDTMLLRCSLDGNAQMREVVKKNFETFIVYQFSGELSDGRKFHKILRPNMSFDGNGIFRKSGGYSPMIGFIKYGAILAAAALAVFLGVTAIKDYQLSAEERAEEEKRKEKKNWSDVVDRSVFVAGRKVRVLRYTETKRITVGSPISIGDDKPRQTYLMKGVGGVARRVDPNGTVWVAIPHETEPKKEYVYGVPASDLEVIEETSPTKEKKALQGKKNQKPFLNQRSQLQPNGPIRPGGLAAGGGGYAAARNNGHAPRHGRT